MRRGWMRELRNGLVVGALISVSGCAAARKPDVTPGSKAPPVTSAPAAEAPPPKEVPSEAGKPSAADRSTTGAGTAGVAADIPKRGRVQTGYATYLAQSFHGQESASGEVFNSRELVAAHRSLPFGTIVRVTNLENGRSVTVRIIDRGPYGKNFREGTIIDLSRAAARRVGMIKDGQVRVRLVILRLADTS